MVKQIAHRRADQHGAHRQLCFAGLGDRHHAQRLATPAVSAPGVERLWRQVRQGDHSVCSGSDLFAAGAVAHVPSGVSALPARRHRSGRAAGCHQYVRRYHTHSVVCRRAVRPAAQFLDARHLSEFCAQGHV